MIAESGEANGSPRARLPDEESEDGELVEKNPLDEVVTCDPMDLDEDTFSMTICALVRDLYFLSRGRGRPFNRCGRLMTTLSLLLMCIFIQVFLLQKVKTFVCAKSVHDVRTSYDQFQVLMYNFTYNTSDNYARGIGEMKHHSNFYTDKDGDGFPSDEFHSNICRIPLSQPDFLFVVLFIWTLTCMTEMRRSRQLFWSLILNTPSCESMRDVLGDKEFDPEEDFVVERLTIAAKALLIVCVFIPRVSITLYLLWVGCRWLLATNSFGDLILNAVALEFILLLKDTLYTALVPNKTRFDVENTKIQPVSKLHHSTMISFVSTMGLAVVAAAWVLLYMGIPGYIDGIQGVLPEYKWDIHKLCVSWIDWRYCVDPPCPASPAAPTAQDLLD